MSKIAVISGASSGIGAATAKKFAREGWKVVIIARRAERLSELADEIGNSAHVFPCDLGNGEAVTALAQQVLSEIGVPDALVHCAGAGEWKPIEDTSPDEALSMMNAPYFASFYLTHAFMPALLKKNKGAILHIGSPVSHISWGNCTGYAAARWALRGLNEALNEDLYGTGVTSSHVVFGEVTSEYFTSNPTAQGRIPRLAEKTIPKTSPEQCAEVIWKVSQNPKREYVYPFMMRFYIWYNRIFPGMTRWLLRVTSA